MRLFRDASSLATFPLQLQKNTLRIHNNIHFPIKKIFATKFSVFLDGAFENLYFIRLDTTQKIENWLVAWSSLEQLYVNDFFRNEN